MERLRYLAERLSAGQELAAFILPGAVVPYVRIGQERHTPRAERYHAYKAAAEADATSLLLLAGVRLTPEQIASRDWYLLCRFYRKRQAGDGDNLYKAIADTLEGVLYQNDRQVKLGAFLVDYVRDAGDERTEVVAGVLGYP